MGTQKIQVITFDLWDTVFIDESDEPKRARQHLSPKPIERRSLVERFLRESGNPLARNLIDIAYDTTDAAFYQVWYGQHLTWTVAERLSVLLKGLGRELAPDQFGELVCLHEDMELDPVPDLAPHIGDILMRSLLCASLRHAQDVQSQASLYLKVPVEQWGMLQFGEIDDIVEAGYRYAMVQVDAWRRGPDARASLP